MRIDLLVATDTAYHDGEGKIVLSGLLESGRTSRHRGASNVPEQFVVHRVDPNDARYLGDYFVPRNESPEEMVLALRSAIDMFELRAKLHG